MTDTSAAAPGTAPANSRHAAWAPIAIAIAAAGFSLRPPITSIGAALGFVPDSTGVDPTVVGWIVTVPLWCYAAGGILTPRLAARWGLVHTVAGALAIMAIGQVVRVAGGAGLLLAGTTVTALATAVVATLLPVIAGRSGAGLTRLTAIYAPAIGIGSAAGAFLTAPVSAATSWRWGLGVWAPLCALALVVWLPARRQSIDAIPYPKTVAVQRTSVPWGRVLSRWQPWLLAVLFAAWAVTAFGVTSWLPSIYQTAGVDRAQAGMLLGIAAAAGIPVAMLLPGMLRRSRPRLPIAFATAIPAAGLVGLWWMPTTLSWLWAVAVGVGLGSLSLVLTLVPLSAPEPEWVTTISAVTHGLGYALAGGGVAALSALHVHIGDWGAILWLLLAMYAVQAAAGVAVLGSRLRPATPARAS
ncbi:MFS transporter [Nocardia sp. NPDC049190]|uniref:MFS transporter n=1 Tax=Nocardia sp. NPDC049190 TaxID=3155650 RepID=UPI0033E2EAF6